MEGADKKSILSWGKSALFEESAALLRCSENLGSEFVSVVRLVLSCTGRVVVTGLGKSGHIGRKISATLVSTGTPSVFLHAAEAIHGDLGILGEEDILFAIAFGGETKEVLNVAKFARRKDIPVIGLTGYMNSSLADIATHVMDGSVDKEACHLNLAPTSSSTVSLGIGDALAISLMKARGFDLKDFAQYHPGGRLGFKLSKVKDHLRTKPTFVDKNADFTQVLAACTEKNYGILGVLEGGELCGVITDGDLRRAIVSHKEKVFELSADQMMTKHPKIIEEERLVIDAVSLMEKNSINTVFVVDDKNPKIVIGLIRMYDILAAKII